MIIIIPYQDDKHCGQELKYAIRSFEKYFSAMTCVIISGDHPGKWYKGEHLQTGDTIGRKEYSMYTKVMLAAGEYEIEKFLYATDDQFAIKPFDENLPNYYSFTCEYMGFHNASGRYRKQYRNCPKGWLNYDIHVPIIMKPFEWGSYSFETDRPIKSTYANQAGVMGTEITDCKFKNPHSKAQIKKIIEGRPFFSTSPFCMNRDMLEILEELYPEKSIFEA